MTNEIKSRPYRKRVRAKQEDETRRRITEAIVELHRTVGPARTTVSEVAELAGVGRMTVYKHFPTELSLFAACSAHWQNQNPIPEFEDCLAKPSINERVEAVLMRLYGYFNANRDMLGNIMSDAPSMPALQEVLDQGWHPMMQTLAAELLPSGVKAAKRKRLLAALSLVLEYRSWESFSESGLSVKEAAQLAAEIIVAVMPEK